MQLVWNTLALDLGEQGQLVRCNGMGETSLRSGARISPQLLLFCARCQCVATSNAVVKMLSERRTPGASALTADL